MMGGGLIAVLCIGLIRAWDGEASTWPEALEMSVGVVGIAALFGRNSASPDLIHATIGEPSGLPWLSIAAGAIIRCIDPRRSHFAVGRVRSSAWPADQ